MVLARRCMDMSRGNFLTLPHAGGMLDQSPLIMSNIEFAWRTWMINAGKAAGQHTVDDVEFMRKYVTGKDDKDAR